MHVELTTHGMRVTKFNDAERDALHKYCKPLIQYGLTKNRNRFEKIPLKVFAAATQNRKEMRFHIGLKDDFMSFMARFGITPTVSTKPVPVPAKAVFRKKAFPTLREEQVPICEYVLENDFRSKLVTLRPGGGKTLCSMYCMAEIGQRTFITTKAGYIQRWVDDLQDKFIFEDNEFLHVKGTPGLIKIMEMALAGTLNASVILLSSKVMYNYLKDYKKSNGACTAYPIKPDEFYEKLGIGLRVIDELHQEFHHNFHMDLFTNVEKTLALSGTMTSSDRFMNRMYDIAYPLNRRKSGGKFKPFILARSLHFRFNDPNNIKWKGPMGGYSHNTFEQWIMRHGLLRKNYFKLIQWAVTKQYTQVREPGQKCLVFCASVDMCSALAEHLQKAFPTLDVRRYTQEDDYDDLLEPDIAVSTVLSAGTAVDIPNLRLALMTTAINSRQSNEQALGRPRPLKDWPDVNPEFFYFVCEDIERHVVYHQEKVVFFEGQVKSQTMVSAPFRI